MQIVKTLVNWNKTTLSQLLLTFPIAGNIARQLPFIQILFTVKPEIRNSQGEAVTVDFAFFLFFFPPCSQKRPIFFYLCT